MRTNRCSDMQTRFVALNLTLIPASIPSLELYAVTNSLQFQYTIEWTTFHPNDLSHCAAVNTVGLSMYEIDYAAVLAEFQAMIQADEQSLLENLHDYCDSTVVADCNMAALARLTFSTQR